MPANTLKPACPTCSNVMRQSKSETPIQGTATLAKWFCTHCNVWKTLNPAEIVKLKK